MIEAFDNVTILLGVDYIREHASMSMVGVTVDMEALYPPKRPPLPEGPKFFQAFLMGHPLNDPAPNVTPGDFFVCGGVWCPSFFAIDRHIIIRDYPFLGGCGGGACPNNFEGLTSPESSEYKPNVCIPF